MVVSSTEIVSLSFNTRYGHMAMWPEAALHSFNICRILTLGFLKLENSFPREEHVLFKPANVNILLSLNKNLLMSRLAIDFKRGLKRYWYPYWSIPAQKNSWYYFVSKLKISITSTISVYSWWAILLLVE